MTVNPDFILRNLAGQYILVSITEGEEAKRLLYLNEIGKDIYNHLRNGLEGDALLTALQEEYDADPDTLCADVAEYLNLLRTYNVIMD